MIYEWVSGVSYEECWKLVREFYGSTGSKVSSAVEYQTRYTKAHGAESCTSLNVFTSFQGAVMASQHLACFPEVISSSSFVPLIALRSTSIQL